MVVSANPARNGGDRLRLLRRSVAVGTLTLLYSLSASPSFAQESEVDREWPTRFGTVRRLTELRDEVRALGDAAPRGAADWLEGARRFGKRIRYFDRRPGDWSTRPGFLSPGAPDLESGWESPFADLEEFRMPAVLVHRRTGVEFIWVSGGTFLLGSRTDEAGRDRMDEGPIERVSVSGFYLARTEITFAQWEAASRLSKQATPQRPSWSLDDHPVCNLNAGSTEAWCGALEFRLPTEAEWEWASSGPENRVYPWGNAWSDTLANWDDNRKEDGSCDGFSRSAPVGSFLSGASWCGALDMAGNVWEWVADPYTASFRGIEAGAENPRAIEPESSPQTGKPAPVGSLRVCRGGAWSHTERDCRTAYRFNRPNNFASPMVGFRPALPR